MLEGVVVSMVWLDMEYRLAAISDDRFGVDRTGVRESSRSVCLPRTSCDRSSSRPSSSLECAVCIKLAHRRELRTYGRTSTIQHSANCYGSPADKYGRPLVVSTGRRANPNLNDSIPVVEEGFIWGMELLAKMYVSCATQRNATHAASLSLSLSLSGNMELKLRVCVRCRCRPPTNQFIHVMDLQDWSPIKNFSRKYTQATAKISQSYYPDYMGVCKAVLLATTTKLLLECLTKQAIGRE